MPLGRAIDIVNTDLPSTISCACLFKKYSVDDVRRLNAKADRWSCLTRWPWLRRFRNFEMILRIHFSPVSLVIYYLFTATVVGRRYLDPL